MTQVNWCDILGWSTEHLQELRYAGYIYLKEGKYDLAKAYFEALTVLVPESAYDLRTLGAVYLLIGDLVNALSSFDKALELDPSHLGTQLNRTKTLLYLGHLDQGLEAAKKLTDCGDTNIANDAQALILAYS